MFLQERSRERLVFDAALVEAIAESHQRAARGSRRFRNSSTSVSRSWTAVPGKRSSCGMAAI